MDKLRAINLFVRVAETGSFTLVADELNASKSMISKELSKLEADIGVRLLHRSTRHVVLTPAGEGYLAHCREILLKLSDADAYVQRLNPLTQGKLRINAPMALATTHLARMFTEFMQAYPNIALDIHLDDAPIDLIEKGFDLGFRASSRPLESNYVGKPLISFKYHVVVAPSYLASHATITTPADLSHHQCFVYSYFKGKAHWPLGEGVDISGRLKVNNILFMLEAIKAGLGVGFIPDFACRASLANGDVVEILQEAERPTLTLYALYPVRHHLPPALKTCVSFLQAWFHREFADDAHLVYQKNHGN
ncbi:MAG: LysR family transcriptional regulator [Hahellaceae bacterium]|nr:LysR family transcriptional regulator [Hahellaceae bacterium]MCP5168284.1 LysR family transcriptional regulator [Hahellaceae bacterium]